MRNISIPGSGLELACNCGYCGVFKCRWNLSLFNDIPPNEPRLQASSSPIPRIRNGVENNFHFVLKIIHPLPEIVLVYATRYLKNTHKLAIK